MANVNIGFIFHLFIKNAAASRNVQGRDEAGPFAPYVIRGRHWLQLARNYLNFAETLAETLLKPETAVSKKVGVVAFGTFVRSYPHTPLIP